MSTTNFSDDLSEHEDNNERRHPATPSSFGEDTIMSGEDEDTEYHKKTATPSTSSSYLQHKCGDLEVVALIGLCVASIAGSLVADMFGLFHVQVFLLAYKLPLNVYSLGSAIFAVINTANDVAGAWLVDWYASHTHRQRHHLIGLSGCLFALCFLTPFFRWPPSASRNSSSDFWDGFHFVGSLSLYDTLFSFNAILSSSIITDNHNMNDTDRILFFAGRRIAQMVAPILVAKIGLSLFNVDHLKPFRIFVLIVAGAACILSIVAQKLINLYKHNDDHPGGSSISFSSAQYSKLDNNDREDFLDEQDDSDTLRDDVDDKGTLRFWQVVKDFASHPNFRYWIIMEMLMEGQNTFTGNFEKTFVDRLLFIDDDQGLSREACDWLLSLMSPMTQLMGFLLYIPIQRCGYARLYKVVFASNFFFACLLLLLNGTSNENDGETRNTIAILLFLVIFSVLSNAMAGAGFGLAMSDMVLEMKHSQTLQGRFDAPSLAGMFMGVNALFCKPTESILPIVTATMLGGTDYENTNSAATRLVLFRLLVFPPLVCSAFQFLVWSRYSLVPERTQQMRIELQSLRDKQNNKPSGGLDTSEGAIEMNSL